MVQDNQMIGQPFDIVHSRRRPISTVKNLFPNGCAAKLEGQRPTSKKKTRAGGEASRIPSMRNGALEAAAVAPEARRGL